MKKFKITYNTQQVINCTMEIRAETKYEALTKFYMDHIAVTEVTKIEEVE